MKRFAMALAATVVIERVLSIMGESGKTKNKKSMVRTILGYLTFAGKGLAYACLAVVAVFFIGGGALWLYMNAYSPFFLGYNQQAIKIELTLPKSGNEPQFRSPPSENNGIIIRTRQSR